MTTPKPAHLLESRNLGHPQPADHPWKRNPASFQSPHYRDCTPFKRTRGCARLQDLKAAHQRVQEAKR